jgi:hypothetical protein
VDAVRREFNTAIAIDRVRRFSQGVAMAYRAPPTFPAAGVIALAGDVPPDVTPEAARQF